MQQQLSKLTGQAILEKLMRLEPQQVAAVVDFIDFLVQRHPKASPLVQWLQATAESRIGLAEVRRRLAKISGTMSETVRELRDERG